MRSYERSGVHVDQCAECRGIFLDRGELERLVDAENSWADRAVAPAPPAPAAPAPPAQPGYAMPPARLRPASREVCSGDPWRGL